MIEPSAGALVSAYLDCSTERTLALPGAGRIGRNHRLLGSAASVLAVVLTATTTPAFAGGGTGGVSDAHSGSAGGTGGSDSVTGTGSPGNPGTYGAGGGGGGAGVYGGAGGAGGSKVCCSAGGGGAPGNGGGTAGAPGNPGSKGTGGGGGGGGGGGAHAVVGITLPTSPVPGSNVGGNGGTADNYGGFNWFPGGGGGGAGGYGVVITATSGNLGNLGVQINAGAGGNGGTGVSTAAGGSGGTGGVGLQLYGTTQVTIGHVSITGGTGGGGGAGGNYGGGNGGTGGMAVNAAGGSTILNYGTINGGHGGYGGNGGNSGYGGSGANGIQLGNGGSLTNATTGVITGGTGGTGGGGWYSGRGGGGGNGVVLGSGSHRNFGTINGGQGGNGGGDSSSKSGGNAGSGNNAVLLLYGASLYNGGGTIIGGYGGNGGRVEIGGNGGGGGRGVLVSTGAFLGNGGVIKGGLGGKSFETVGYGGAGGTGVFVGPGARLANGGLGQPNAVIYGGNGGKGGTDGLGGGAGGAGGSGVVLYTDGLLYNSGKIFGGNGAKGLPDGAGGNGITAYNYTTIINRGGHVYNGGSDSGAVGKAIEFRGGGNRLELWHGSVIVGTVDATKGSNDTLALGGPDNDTFDVGQIGDSRQYRGFEKFEKTGTSTWTLTGTTAASGPWTVNQGRLTVNGSLAASSGLTVNAGGLVGGSGTLPHTTISGGTLAPGNSIGTINVQGNFVHNGGTHQLEIDPAGRSDRVAVTGTATINGPTVYVLAAQGSYANSTTYTIVNATAGLTGAYGSVVEDFAFLSPSLSYDPNNAFLTLALGPNAFSSGGITPNQKAVGAALDASFAGASGDFATVIGALAGLTTAQGPPALSAISGQPWANFGTMNVAGNALFMNAVGQQMALARGAMGGGQRVALAEACEAPAACQVMGQGTATGPWSAWVNALGGLGSVLGDGNAGTFTYNLGGLAAGVDYRLDPRFLVGLGVGYSHGTQWTDGFMGQGWSDSVSVALYASFSDAGFYLDALAGYAWSGNQLERQINIPNLQPRTANGSTGANQFLGQVEGGYRIGIYERALASVTPFGRLQISSVNQNGFTESGAGSLGLEVAPQTTTSVRPTIGADLAGRLPLGPTTGLDVALRLGWMHEFADTSRPIAAAFTGAPSSGFTVFGATPARNSAVVGFSASTAIAETTSLYLRYDGQVGGGTDNHALNVGVRMTW